jgi:phosphoribosylanthranilate isomerase
VRCAESPDGLQGVGDGVTDIKFCGMTRPADVVVAAALGARYVGCVLAGGPRHRTATEAALVFGGLDRTTGPRRVGVFARSDPASLAAVVDVAGLDVVQLHGDPTAEDLVAVRSATEREIWAVVRCAGTALPAGAASLWRIADAVLIDAHSPDRLGGTGTVLPWSALADAVRAVREAEPRPVRLVLAGGLTPDNVGQAIAALRPDVVDTSSGIESAPGIKDPVRMIAFAQAVAAADRMAAPSAVPPRSSS